MSTYRKKPVTIEAFKLGVDYIPDWFMDSVTANEVILHGSSSGFNHIADTNADIHTLEGWHHANYGDYIIRGVKGELYPCKPDIFEMTYEMVDKSKTNADRIRAMRLIDANVVMDSIIDQLEIEWGYEGIREDVKRIFEDAPTVDAVEVVRCEKCNYGHWLSGAKKYACRHPLYTGGNKHSGEHFCSYAERRTGE